MIELLCGLVGIVVIISMLLQINLIGRAHLGVVVAARTSIADEVLNASASSEGQFLSNWVEGDDEYRYSLDDEAEAGRSGTLSDALATGTNVEELETYLEGYGFDTADDQVVAAAYGNLVDVLYMASVTEESVPVEVLPGVQQLVYGAEELEFSHEIHMPLIETGMGY